MTRIRAAIAWVGGLAVLCSLLLLAWTRHGAERARPVASAAIGPGIDAHRYWPKGLSGDIVATEVGERARATGAPVCGPESPGGNPGEAVPLLPIPQPDVAWEPPLVGPRDRGDSRLEVDEECRPIQVAKTSRLKDRGNAEDREDAAAGGAAGGEPTLAPPPPPESDAGRRVIRVVVEAEQAAWKQDAHQP